MITGGGVPQPYPPPAGYAWFFVVSGTDLVVSSGTPVVALKRVA